MPRAKKPQIQTVPAATLPVRPALWASLAVVLVSVLAFAAVRHFAFVSWDDPSYITENPVVLRGLSWHGAWWALTTDHGPYWHPVTWLSHMLDVQFYGLNAGGHHVTSLLLHVMTSVVLLVVLYRMTGVIGRSAFVAGLFAVHPLHVESVAWIAERKDVVSALFWMLTIAAYVRYVREPSRGRYTAVVGLFALGLMAKPMVVTLPLVLLLLDVWPLRRIAIGSGGARARRRMSPGATWTTLLWEKIPLIVLALAVGAGAFMFQQRVGAVAALATVPLDFRLTNAAMSYVAYIAKTIWPDRLAALYPYPQALPAWWMIVAAVGGLLAVSAAVVRAAGSRPYLMVGWFWYLLTLLPVIGFVQVGEQSMADRFTYLPIVGLFVMVAWAVPDLAARWPARRIVLPAGAMVVVALCAIVARVQARTWTNSVTMWQHALDVTTGNYHAHAALGALLAGQGRAAEAMAEKTEALRINPEDPSANNEMGILLEQQGRNGAAIPYLEKALSVNPNYAEAHHNLGVAFVNEGHLPTAIAQFAEALRLEPDLARTQNALGLALAHEGRLDEAVGHFSDAVRLEPDFAAAHYNLGAALTGRGQVTEAIAEFRDALRCNPRYAEAHHNLGVALASQGRTSEAIVEYGEALHVDPDLADAHANLAIALDAQGRLDDALHEALEAVRILPGRPDFQYTAAAVLSRRGDIRDALAHLEAALKIDPHFDAARKLLDELEHRLDSDCP